MTPRIAVTTDFSEYSKRALPVAVALARRFGSEIFLVHQALLPPRREPIDGPTHCRMQAERLEREAERASARFHVPIRPVLISGGDGKTFGDELCALRIDYLVLETHGYVDAKRDRLGSFVEMILPFCPCPLLLLRGDMSCDAQFAPTRILVADDYGAHGGSGVSVAHDWALEYGAHARLLALEERPLAAYGDELERERERERDPVTLGRTLQALVNGSWRNVPTDIAVAEGRPLDEILRNASTYEADLIVIRGHGQSYLDQSWLGQVAADVGRFAPCPVLILRGVRCPCPIEHQGEAAAGSRSSPAGRS